MSARHAGETEWTGWLLVSVEVDFGIHLRFDSISATGVCSQSLPSQSNIEGCDRGEHGNDDGLARSRDNLDPDIGLGPGALDGEKCNKKEFKILIVYQ